MMYKTIDIFILITTLLIILLLLYTNTKIFYFTSYLQQYSNNVNIFMKFKYFIKRNDNTINIILVLLATTIEIIIVCYISLISYLILITNITNEFTIISLPLHFMINFTILVFYSKQTKQFSSKRIKTKSIDKIINNIDILYSIIIVSIITILPLYSELIGDLYKDKDITNYYVIFTFSMSVIVVMHCITYFYKTIFNLLKNINQR